jgi:hypothetical protein
VQKAAAKAAKSTTILILWLGRFTSTTFTITTGCMTGKDAISSVPPPPLLLLFFCSGKGCAPCSSLIGSSPSNVFVSLRLLLSFIFHLLLFFFLLRSTKLSLIPPHCNYFYLASLYFFLKLDPSLFFLMFDADNSRTVLGATTLHVPTPRWLGTGASRTSLWWWGSCQQPRTTTTPQKWCGWQL